MCGFVAVKAPSTSDWTNGVVPIVLIVAAFRVSRTYPERVRVSASGAG